MRAAMPYDFSENCDQKHILYELSLPIMKMSFLGPTSSFHIHTFILNHFKYKISLK